MKNSISITLIFLILLNTSCYSTYSIRKEDINTGKTMTVTTNNEIEYQIITEKVTEDTLYCRKDKNRMSYWDYNIAIPIKNIKSVEVKEYSQVQSILLISVIGAIVGAGIVHGILQNNVEKTDHEESKSPCDGLPSLPVESTLGLGCP